MTSQPETALSLSLRFDAAGLAPVVVTHADSGDVLMLAYMNAQALQQTVATGQAHYWSRSRNRLWRKGATSGQVQQVVEIRVDCDQDALWLRVRPGGDGGCCHAGFPSCFYRTLQGDGATLRFNQAPLRQGSETPAPGVGTRS